MHKNNSLMERIEQKNDVSIDVYEYNSIEIAIAQVRMGRNDTVYVEKQSIPALIDALKKYI